MATFSISISIEVEADNYDEAYALRDSLMTKLNELREVNDVVELDVEQQDGFEDDEE